MNTQSLNRDIQDFSLELLLTSEGVCDAESLSVALQRLAAIVHNAAQVGAESVVGPANRLIQSVESVRNSMPPKDVLPILLEGLKTLEVSESNPNVSVPAVPESRPSSQDNSLAQDPELLQDFILEAREHLSVVEAQLLTLEQNPGESEPTHACFRAIHTIKGVAGFLELDAVREVSHEAETLLDELRNGRLAVTPAFIDVMLKTADFLHQEVAAVEALLAGLPRREQANRLSLIQNLRAMKNQEAKPAEQLLTAIPAVPSSSVESVAAPLSNNDIATPENCPTPKEEPMVSAAANKPVRETKQATASAARSVKVDMEKLDYLADMVGELVVTQSMLQPQQGTGGFVQDSPMARNLTQLARITSEVQKTAMSMRMVPVGQLFQRLSRLVRDVSRQVGKTIELELSGEEIELDRSMVEELTDPLMHMVRNSIDHGIESPEQRKESGKGPVGRIFLKAKHEAGQVQIEISDDGRGLDRNKILAKARQKGLVDPAASLTDAEVLNLIFEPGFSTAEKVTDLSGRGVGMDVVRKQIQKLRGRVDLRSALGQGTTFFLRLPLTLAIIDGLVVMLGGERYILPISAVREVLHPNKKMVFTVEGNQEMAMVRDRLLPLVRLYRWLKVQPRSENLLDGILVVVEAQGKTYCLAVDELLGKQEVVIKSLGKFLESAPGIAGGAILGNGRVGLILDPDAVAGRSPHE